MEVFLNLCLHLQGEVKEESHHRLHPGQRRHQIAKPGAANFKIAVLVERGAGRRQQHHGIGKAGSLSIARGIGHRDVERYGAFDP